MEKKKYENLSYEEAISELEKIIQKLENGNVGLEDSLELYKDGTQLASLCSDKLAAAEKQIMMLTRSADGKMVENEFESAEEDGR